MRLHLPRLRRRTASVAVPVHNDRHWMDLPGAVRFQTEIAKQRFIRIEPMGDAVHFVAPRTRYWPGQSDYLLEQFVTRGALPDTVTCGKGYIEVLAFVDNGIVVNEVRTHGDQVVAMAGSALQPG
jgi:hypothetical protein